MSPSDAQLSNLAKKWLKTAERLGLRIETPASILLPSKCRIAADARLLDFGGHKGILLVADHRQLQGRGEEIVDCGYGYSVLSEPSLEVNAEADLETAKEVLRDWEWWGDPTAEPAWLQECPGEEHSEP